MSTDHLYTTKASYDVMKSRAEARCAALEEEILRERESRKQAFNAGWNAAIEEIAEKAPYMRLFRLRESIRLNLRPPPEPRKVVTQDDIDRIDAEEGPNRAVVKGRSERFGDSHD